jgi:hypothetical protein
MALGFLATAATIPKIISVKYYGFKGDATFHTSDVLLWSLLEVNLGIIAACVPTLRGPFETALKQWGLISATQLGTKPTSPGYQRQGHEQRMPPRRPSDSQFSMPWDKKVPVEKASWLEISTDDLSKMRQR